MAFFFGSLRWFFCGTAKGSDRGRLAGLWVLSARLLAPREGASSERTGNAGLPPSYALSEKHKAHHIQFWLLPPWELLYNKPMMKVTLYSMFPSSINFCSRMRRISGLEEAIAHVAWPDRGVQTFIFIRSGSPGRSVFNKSRTWSIVWSAFVAFLFVMESDRRSKKRGENEFQSR